MSNTLYDSLSLLSLQVAFICLCFIVVAYRVHRLFNKIGYGSVGIALLWGFILLTVGFAFLGVASWISIYMPVEDRLALSIIGRAFQSFGALLIVLGFGWYYDWATGKFTRFDRLRFLRRTNPKVGSSTLAGDK